GGAAGRCPGGIASLATILAVSLWVRRGRGDRAAALAALVLMFTYMYWTYMRYSAADVFLTFAVTLSIFALDALARRRDGSDAIWGALSGGALALSFGFKGLAGLVMPVGGVAAGVLCRPARARGGWRAGAGPPGGRGPLLV